MVYIAFISNKPSNFIGFFSGKSIPRNFYIIKIHEISRLFDDKDNQSFSRHTRIICKYFLTFLYNTVQKKFQPPSVTDPEMPINSR